MKKKVKLRVLAPKSITIFKICNRRGYAAICRGNLTEGTTPFQSYYRMNKALKRMGLILRPISAKAAQRLVKKNI